MENPMRAIAIIIGFISVLASACVIETSDGPRGQVVASGNDGGTVLIDRATIDTGATMTQVPGDGIGVFVEYAAGGLWHVWWTCDSNKTHQTCEYSLTAHVTGGARDLVGEGLLGKNLTALSDGFIATSTTDVQAHGLTFRTNAGATLSLSANIAGIRDTNFLFFVQDNKVVGGSEADFANPMSLTGRTP